MFILPLLFSIITITFGFFFTVVISKGVWPVCTQIAASWVIGSMLISLVLWFASFLFGFTHECMLGTMIILGVIFIDLFKRCKPKYFKKFELEKSPWLFLSMLIMGAISFCFTNRIYSQYPNYAPKESIEIFKTETSFINSLLNGTNKHRSKIMSFQDINHNQHSFSRGSLPLIFVAALMSLGSTYSEASIFISVMNTLATVVLLFAYIRPYTKHTLAVCMWYLLNGSWAFVRILYGRYNDGDLIHDIGRAMPVPWYQTTCTFLCMSKTSSFTIPLALLASALASSSKVRSQLIGGISACLIPSFHTTVALFIAISNYSPGFLKYAFCLLPKFISTQLVYKPIWREYQMEGYFYSQLLCWIDGIGIPFMSLFVLPFAHPSPIVLQRVLSTMSAFLFLCFFREGNNYFGNVLAIQAVFYPMLCISVVECSRFFLFWFKQKQLRGMAFTVDFITHIVSALGAFISMSLICQHIVPVFTDNDKELASWVLEKVPADEPIFCGDLTNNPIPPLTGHKVFISSLRSLWNRGDDVDDAIRTIMYVKSTHNYTAPMQALNYKYAIEKRTEPFIGKCENYIAYNDDWCLMQIQDN